MNRLINMYPPALWLTCCVFLWGGQTRGMPPVLMGWQWGGKVRLIKWTQANVFSLVSRVTRACCHGDWWEGARRRRYEIQHRYKPSSELGKSRFLRFDGNFSDLTELIREPENYLISGSLSDPGFRSLLVSLPVILGTFVYTMCLNNVLFCVVTVKLNLI